MKRNLLIGLVISTISLSNIYGMHSKDPFPGYSSSYSKKTNTAKENTEDHSFQQNAMQIQEEKPRRKRHGLKKLLHEVGRPFKQAGIAVQEICDGQLSNALVAMTHSEGTLNRYKEAKRQRRDTASFRSEAVAESLDLSGEYDFSDSEGSVNPKNLKLRFQALQQIAQNLQTKLNFLQTQYERNPEDESILLKISETMGQIEANTEELQLLQAQLASLSAPTESKPTTSRRKSKPHTSKTTTTSSSASDETSDEKSSEE